VVRKLRDRIICGRVPIDELAIAEGYTNPRPVREFVRREKIPAIRIKRVLHVDIDAYREARERASAQPISRTSSHITANKRPSNDSQPSQEART
jgi:hypothetical protein